MFAGCDTGYDGGLSFMAERVRKRGRSRRTWNEQLRLSYMLNTCKSNVVLSERF